MTPDRANPEQEIAQILETLRRSREFLLDPSPQNIDYCGMMASQCATRMARLLEKPELAMGAGKSLDLVRSEINAITDLLASAATFRRNLLGVMHAAALPITTTANPSLEEASEKARSVHVLC